jgi:Reverse transcriptase (RNA-dependent DNA polymerase)
LRDYTVEDFEYLIGTTHIDPEDNLEYTSVRVRKHGRYIAIDRRLTNSINSPTEAIHALDIAKLTKTTPNHRTSQETSPQKCHRTSQETSPQKCHRTSQEADINMNFYNNLVDAEIKKRVNEVKIPRNSREARNSNEATEWLASEKDEIGSLETAGCMIVVDLPQGVTPIDSKFVYSVKSNTDSIIVRYKSRMTGRGDQLVEGLDFLDSYSPVVGWIGIRLFLATTVLLELIPLQLDCDLA